MDLPLRHLAVDLRRDEIPRLVNVMFFRYFSHRQQAFDVAAWFLSQFPHFNNTETLRDRTNLETLRDRPQLREANKFCPQPFQNQLCPQPIKEKPWPAN
jgi:hypothetical protein